MIYDKAIKRTWPRELEATLRRAQENGEYAQQQGEVETKINTFSDACVLAVQVWAN